MFQLARALVHGGAVLLLVAVGGAGAAEQAPFVTPPGRVPAAEGPAPGAAADPVVRFRLPDQFGAVHDAADYRGQPFYLVGTARAGQASALQWVRTLRAAAVAPPGHPPEAVVPIADLSAVPHLLRGFVRGHFTRDPQRPVLLDWDGAVARRLGFDPSRCTVVVVDAAGRPVLRTSTLATDTATIDAFARRADAAVQADTTARW